MLAAVGAVAELPRLALADRREVPSACASTAPLSRGARSASPNAISASANRRSRNAATPASAGPRAARVEVLEQRVLPMVAHAAAISAATAAARRASDRQGRHLGEMVERAQRVGVARAPAARARRVSASCWRSAARADAARGTPPASLRRRAAPDRPPRRAARARGAQSSTAHAGEEIRRQRSARDEAAVLEIEVGVARGDDPIQQGSGRRARLSAPVKQPLYVVGGGGGGGAAAVNVLPVSAAYPQGARRRDRRRGVTCSGATAGACEAARTASPRPRTRRPRRRRPPAPRRSG